MADTRRFDRIFKSLADADPRGLLHLFGILSLDQPATVEPLDREVGVPALLVDHAYRVSLEDREWIAHFEAQARYRGDEPERLTEYGTMLGFKTKLPVTSTLVLLVEKHARRKIPQTHKIRFGSIEIRCEFKVIRLWKIKARLALEVNRPNLLPWVALLDASAEELEEAVEKIEELRDRKLAAQCNILGSLRYDESSFPRVLERIGSMLSEEILQESWLYNRVKKNYEEKLRQEGRLIEARRSLRLLISLRFPTVGDLPALDAINDNGVLEHVQRELILARDESSARRILAAAQVS